jgi:hypothetical protein
LTAHDGALFQLLLEIPEASRLRFAQKDIRPLNAVPRVDFPSGLQDRVQACKTDKEHGDKELRSSRATRLSFRAAAVRSGGDGGFLRHQSGTS